MKNNIMKNNIQKILVGGVAFLTGAKVAEVVTEKTENGVVGLATGTGVFEVINLAGNIAVNKARLFIEEIIGPKECEWCGCCDEDDFELFDEDDDLLDDENGLEEEFDESNETSEEPVQEETKEPATEEPKQETTETPANKQTSKNESKPEK